MINVNKTHAEIEGNSGDLLVEAAVAITAVCETVAENDVEFMGAALYSVVLAASKELKERNPRLDVDFLFQELGKGLRN